MASRQVRIGFNYPGTMVRLGLHTGATLAWLFYGLPIPVLAVGTSVGALVLACMISFQKKEMHRMAPLVGNLKREQIYTFSKALMQTGAYLLAAGAVLVVSAAAAGSLGLWWAALLIALGALYIYARFRGTVVRQWTLRVLLLMAALAAGHWGDWTPAVVFWIGLFVFDWLARQAIRTFFTKCESPFDTTPLFKLLRNNISFRHFFGATTELRIITAEIETPSLHVISNRDPGLCDPDNSDHCDRIADAVRATTALPGRFQLIRIDGKVLRDAEVWTAYPIDEFRGKVDIVFRFDYWGPLEPEPAPKHWLGDLFRSFDVLRDGATLERMEKYQLELQRDPTLPRVVNIRISDELKRRVPEVAVYDFKSGQLWRSIRLGYRIIKENLPMIRRELDSV